MLINLGGVQQRILDTQITTKHFGSEKLYMPVDEVILATPFYPEKNGFSNFSFIK